MTYTHSHTQTHKHARADIQRSMCRALAGQYGISMRSNRCDGAMGTKNQEEEERQEVRKMRLAHRYGTPMAAVEQSQFKFPMTGDSENALNDEGRTRWQAM